MSAPGGGRAPSLLGQLRPLLVCRLQPSVLLLALALAALMLKARLLAVKVALILSVLVGGEVREMVRVETAIGTVAVGPLILVRGAFQAHVETDWAAFVCHHKFLMVQTV